VADLEDAARRAARGDARAFRAIVDATGERLYRLALRMTGDADDASDVLQEAYLRAHRALRMGEFRGTSQLETWLYRIVVNAALNHRRGRTRHARLVEPDRTTATSPDTSAEISRVMALVRELPPEQKAALVLKELEGHTSAEIGRLVGCSEGAVEQRLVRARETLRRRLTDG
jgi:RNA polymerase sigma-70 factor, ECF subfamily